MKKLEEICEPGGPLKRILREFLHLEWYSVNELKEKLRAGALGVDADRHRLQFKQIVDGEDIPIQDVNDLTANQFESADEVRAWASGIYKIIFYSG